MTAYFAAILSGVLTALAFPKASLWPFVFVSLVPFFISIKKSDKLSEILILSFLFGLFYFGILFNGISELFAFIAFPAYFAWLALVVFESLFIALFAVIVDRFYFKAEKKNLLLLFLIPSLWVVIEWLRTLGVFGVSGGLLGYSMAGILPFIQIAGFSGVYGVSFVIVLVNVSIMQAITSFKENKFSLVITFAIICLVLLFGVFNSPGYSRREVRLAIIQPNIPQIMKLDNSLKDNIFDIHADLTREILLLKPDIVFWPETVSRTYLLYDDLIQRKIRNLFKGFGSYLVAGFPHFEAHNVYNSAFAFSPDAKIIGRYDKQNPVPFGEYLPAKFLLYPLLKRFGGGYNLFEGEYNSNPDAKLLKLGKLKLGVVICFESTLSHLLRNRAKAEADILVVLTNDAWFGSSSMAFQHVDIGVFRAIESGRPLVHVSNTGPSAVIDQKGNVIAKFNIERKGAFVVPVNLGLKDTLYMRYGNFFVFVLIIFLLTEALVTYLSGRGFMK